MTNHHDELRVAPDPARAEELRQRLHARLASGSPAEPLVPTERAVASIPSADTDPDDREGDLIMLETEDRPIGHEPPRPGRRSPSSWLLVAAAVAVLAVVGAVLVAAAGDDDETQVPATDTTAPAPAQDIADLPEFSELEPGPYFIDPDGDDATPLRVTYDVAAEGWSQWPGAVKFQDDGHVALSIMAIDNLVRHGCTDHRLADPAVGPSVDDLAIALSQLAPFEVTSPPSDVTMFGYEGKHLQLTVPDLPVTGSGETREFAGCTDGNLNSWSGENHDGAFYGYNADPGTTEDYWILDVDGTRLVFITLEIPGSPAQDREELQAIFDSISIEP
jgi:hypothetical protein